MWTVRAHSQREQEPGKWSRGPSTTSSWKGSPSVLNAQTIEHIPTISRCANTAYVTGKINGFSTNILLDCGASCSVIRSECVLAGDVKPMSSTTLTNADGTELSLMETTTVPVILNGLNTSHTFIVVEHLSAPVILGCDFLSKHGVILDFGNGTFHCNHPGNQPKQLESQECLNMVVLDHDIPQAMPCSIKESHQVELGMPQNYHKSLELVLKEHAALFRCQLGRTNVAKHVIDTGDAPPVKMPSRPIPFHYTEQVQSQLKNMAKEGIIRASNSPWCAPAVYVPKSNGEVRICVDFVQLNKATKKDPYPVPQADGPQQKLANKKIFSKIDLQSAY